MRKISIATLAATLLVSSHASAINTRVVWTGQSVGSFGCPESTVFGQTIFVPKFKHTIGDVTFTMESDSGPGSLTMRGEVFKWDGSKAVGSALYESDPITVNFKLAKYRPVKFSPNVSVTPGAEYVVFMTVDKDYAQCTNGTFITLWGAVNDSVYSKGTFVFLNAAGNSTAWTQQTWGSGLGVDTAFIISMPN